MANIKLMARVKVIDDKRVIELKGKVLVSGLGSEYEYDICNCGGMDNAKVHAFKDMDKLAQSYGGKISYAVN